MNIINDEIKSFLNQKITTIHSIVLNGWIPISTPYPTHKCFYNSRVFLVRRKHSREIWTLYFQFNEYLALRKRAQWKQELIKVGMCCDWNKDEGLILWQKPKRKGRLIMRKATQDNLIVIEYSKRLRKQKLCTNKKVLDFFREYEDCIFSFCGFEGEQYCNLSRGLYDKVKQFPIYFSLTRGNYTVCLFILCESPAWGAITYLKKPMIWDGVVL